MRAKGTRTFDGERMGIYMSNCVSPYTCVYNLTRRRRPSPVGPHPFLLGDAEKRVPDVLVAQPICLREAGVGLHPHHAHLRPPRHVRFVFEILIVFDARTLAR